MGKIPASGAAVRPRSVLVVLFCAAAAIAAPGAVLGGKSPAAGSAGATLVAAGNENRAAAGSLVNGVLTVNLVIESAVWHPKADDGREHGRFPHCPASILTPAFAEVGRAPQIPGPLLRAPVGTLARVSVRNDFNAPLYLHGFGGHGAGPLAVVRLSPGESKDLQFQVGAPGSYLYWASSSDSGDLPLPAMAALAGAFIVDPSAKPASDRVFVVQLYVQDLYRPSMHAALTINGKEWPYTERLHYRIGQPVYWRILNASRLMHPMHLHGFFFTVPETGDGERETQTPLADRAELVTEPVAPGHTFDMAWTPDRPGHWLFHCHILDHSAMWTPSYLFGPSGRPATVADPVVATPAKYAGMSDMGGMRDDMSAMVMGIDVTGAPASALAPPPASAIGARFHLFVRPRPARPYVPAGPGYFLAGVSRAVGAIGPPLVLKQGVTSAITVTNQLDEPTSVHWHGLEDASYYDGVPGWDGTAGHREPPILPGRSFTAYLTPRRAGTYIYHTHLGGIRQLTGGLYGALLVLPPGQKFDPYTDRIFVLGRSGPDLFRDPLVLNGSPQPGMTVLLLGRAYRLRIVNITPNDQPITVALRDDAGAPQQWRALARDAADLPPALAVDQPAQADVSVGGTEDFSWTPTTPGAYRLTFYSDEASQVTQVFLVVPKQAPFAVFAAPGAGPGR